MTPEQIDLRKYSDTEVKAELIEERRDFLIQRGFTPQWVDHFQKSNPTLIAPENVTLHLEGLHRLGFSNPQKMVESSHRLLRLGLDNIDRKLKGLQDRGFKDPISMSEKSPAILGLTFDTIDSKLQGLSDRGFRKLHKMIENVPAILGLRLDTIDRKLQDLSDLGFSNPIKMIENVPAILGLRLDTIDRKLQDLSDLGFSNPIKMVESFPAILSIRIENIDEKLKGLSERGFRNPQKMVESLPSVFGYSFENIDNKIQGLEERGFINPHTMVESSPSILGCSFENIDRRIRVFNRLIRLYDLPFESTKLMEHGFALFSSKVDKILVLTRVVREFQGGPQELNEKVLQRLVWMNLEDILVALSMEDPENDTLMGLVNRANGIKKQKLPKDEKRRSIAESLGINDKIKQRYFRGYPEE